MIASLRGTVVSLSAGSAVVEVHGVGYEFLATSTTLASLREGSEVLIYTSLVVREDSMTLFGFEDADSKGVFETLQTVSGVGPKVALAVLATLTPDQLRAAVAHGDVAALTRVSGIGKKGAQRMILEIGTKLGPVLGDSDAAVPAASVSDVVQALVGLGWSENDSESVVAEVAQAMTGATVPDLLRACLQTLGARK